MEYIVQAATDIGLKKNTNQDSLTVKTIKTPIGKIVFALLCDGMGGLAKGEVASAELIDAFDYWVKNQLPILSQSPLDYKIIKQQWTDIAVCENEKIRTYGSQYGINLGTTAVAMLITDKTYIIMNIGDSRAYEIDDNVIQLTNDQTLVAREVEYGNLTEEQAKVDPRRSVLLQCVGASLDVVPEFFVGDTKQNSVYMLCSDGFRHEITPEEIFEKLQPDVMLNEHNMKDNMDYLIDLNKQRMEQDNISVIAVRTL